MNSIKTWIIIILAILFVGYSFITTHKYNQLEMELVEYKSKDTVENNQYILENEMLKQEIKILQEDLDICYMVLDSLKHLKQQVVIQETFKESENITEGVKTLKDNLKWERY